MLTTACSEFDLNSDLGSGLGFLGNQPGDFLWNCGKVNRDVGLGRFLISCLALMVLLG